MTGQKLSAVLLEDEHEFVTTLRSNNIEYSGYPAEWTDDFGWLHIFWSPDIVKTARGISRIAAVVHKIEGSFEFIDDDTGEVHAFNVKWPRKPLAPDAGVKELVLHSIIDTWDVTTRRESRGDDTDDRDDEATLSFTPYRAEVVVSKRKICVHF